MPESPERGLALSKALGPREPFLAAAAEIRAARMRWERKVSRRH